MIIMNLKKHPTAGLKNSKYQPIIIYVDSILQANKLYYAVDSQIGQ